MGLFSWDENLDIILPSLPTNIILRELCRRLENYDEKENVKQKIINYTRNFHNEMLRFKAEINGTQILYSNNDELAPLIHFFKEMKELEEELSELLKVFDEDEKL